MTNTNDDINEIDGTSQEFIKWEEEITDIENLLEEDIKEAEKAEEKIEWEIKELWRINEEITNLKDALARAQADYQNLIRRVERDREEMSTYLTSSVILKMLPFVDNMERLVTATPENDRNTPLFEWIKSTLASLQKTLEWLWVKTFESMWQEADDNLHHVMTQMPWKEWIVIQEFEKWYMIWEKVLRHAKVVVGNWE